MSKPKVVVWGTPQMAVEILLGLLNQIKIVAIITTPDQPQGRKKILTPCPLKDFAQSYHLPVFSPQSLKNSPELTAIRSLSADIWLVIAYGKIIPSSILELMPHKIFNIHPSLLPKYRGPSPLQTALMDGQSLTGVSLMEIDNLMDHGPIVAQQIIPIATTDTILELEKKVIQTSISLLKTYLPHLTKSKISSPQDDSQASYSSIIQKSDGLINWQQDSAKTIRNKWRAFKLWPKISSYLNTGQKVIFEHIVLDCSQLSLVKLSAGHWQYQDGKLLIATQNGCIAVTHLTVAGKASLEAKSFANGYQDSFFI